MSASKNSFDSLNTLTVGDRRYGYYAINGGDLAGNASIARLPMTSKILLENLLRHEDGLSAGREDIQALIESAGKGSNQEISYHPARVLMQDFTGVPGVVDLAAMRDALVKQGVGAQKINPLSRVDLVIDHSLSIDKYATNTAFDVNVSMEMERNLERYQFLKWGQSAFHNFSVVPPGTGICHQVNLEYLAKVVWQEADDDGVMLYPDTLVGTDSHTTMINGLGVLGWGVGGIEAEAAMLGQPISMLIPDVVGLELCGKLREGITATDLVLRVVELLREHGAALEGPGFVDEIEERVVDSLGAGEAVVADRGGSFGFWGRVEEDVCREVSGTAADAADPHTVRVGPLQVDALQLAGVGPLR